MILNVCNCMTFYSQIKSLNDKNFAVVLDLLHAFCRLIDSLDLFSKQMVFKCNRTNVHLHVSFCCEICTDFYKVNIRITLIFLVLFQHLLD